MKIPYKNKYENSKWFPISIPMEENRQNKQNIHKENNNKISCSSFNPRKANVVTQIYFRKKSKFYSHYLGLYCAIWRNVALMKSLNRSNAIKNHNQCRSLWRSFQFIYALNVLFAYLYMYFAHWNRIPITFRSRILRFFTQANASFRNFLFYCPLTCRWQWLAVNGNNN